MDGSPPGSTAATAMVRCTRRSSIAICGGSGAGEGFPTAIALEGSPSSLHVVLARSARESIEIDGIEITRDPTPRPYTLLGLEGPPSLDVAFTLLGDALYFNDEGQDPGERR